jgi:hypothetical protein
MPSVYSKISEDAQRWVAAASAASGLSMSRVIDLVLLEARRRNWQIEISGARITDTSGSPAADSHEPAKGSVPRDQGRAVDVPPQSAPGPPSPFDDPYVNDEIGGQT